ncbi:MAG: putative Ig domain-containing protein, partial [Deltaproteobacteria bacterium]|nr:putative Ig domain-containing protein [Deltaproteobacteria bacterium]
FYVGLALDPVVQGGPAAGAFPEVDETNNGVFAGSPTTVSRSDLVVEDVQISDLNSGAPVRAGYMGTQQRVSVRIRNIGGDAANGFSIGVIASKDANLSLLSDWRVEDHPSTPALGFNLPACTTLKTPETCPVSNFTFDMTLPSTDRLGAPLQPGELYLFFQADSFEELIEIKEDNNSKRFGSPVRLFVPGPDLVAARVSAPSASAAGEVIPVFRRFRNVGVTDATSVTYQYRISVNPLVTEQDPLLEIFAGGAFVTGNTLSLAAGAQDDATEFVRIPAGLAPGLYYVGAIIDSSGAVGELDEVNNAVSASSAMAVTAPALRITTQQLPDAAVDRPYLVRLASSAPFGTVTWSTPAALPAGMTLDATTGTLGGTPALAGVYALNVQAEANGRTAVARLVLRVLASSGALSVLTTALPPVVNANQPYGASFAAAGGRRPYTWRLSAGTLPKGLVLNADGTVSGTPIPAQNTLGESSVTAEVVDASGNRATGSVKIRVVGAGSLIMQAVQLPDAMVGSDYLADVQAAMANGTPLASPLTWTVSAGELPAGVTLSSVNDRGVFGGKAVEAGTFSFTLQVEDAVGRVDTADHVVRIFPSAFRVSGEPAATYYPGDEVTLQLAATTSSPVTYRIYSGELPPGLRMTEAGLVSGFINSDPEVSVGGYNVVLSARASDGAESFSALSFNVVRRPEAAGCSAGAGGPSAWLVALALGSLRLRRRKAAAWVSSVAVGLLALLPGRALAQYAYSTQGAVSPGTYTALTGSNAGTVVYEYDASVWSTGWTVSLPFPFEFYGQSYTTVGVALEGYLDFGQTDLSTTSNRAIPHSNSIYPHVAVAAWWDSLYDKAPSSAGPATRISTRTFGTAPNREFVVDWANISSSSSSSASRFSFQVRLFEGTNRIRISYAPNASPSTGSATVGIMGGLGVGLPGLSCTTSTSGNCTPTSYPAGKDIDFALPVDLTVPAVSGDDTAYAGTVFRADATLRNGGGTPAPGAKVRYFLSVDTALDVFSDVLLGDSAAVDLAPGKESVVTGNVLVPQAVLPGAYYLFALADPDNLLAEPNESNNASSGMPLTVGAPRPDLQVVSLSPSATAATPGQTLGISRTLSNTGNAATGATVKYTYLLSDNAVASYSDFALTPAGDLVSLNAGGSNTATDQVVLPADLPAGRYWIGLCADYDPQANPVSTILEISEVNNCYTSPQS